MENFKFYLCHIIAYDIYRTDLNTDYIYYSKEDALKDAKKEADDLRNRCGLLKTFVILIFSNMNMDEAVFDTVYDAKRT